MTATAVILVVCFIGIVVLAVIASGCPSEAKPENENNDATPGTGTLEIIQTFEGLDNVIIPEMFELHLLFPKDTSKKYDLWSDLELLHPTRYVFFHWYTEKFQLSRDCGTNAQLEQIWNEDGNVCGFKWKFTDLLNDTYYVKACIGDKINGCVPGYHRKGSRVNGGDLQWWSEEFPVTIKTNGLTTLSLTEVYEPNRAFTEDEKAALAEMWRAHNALEIAYLNRENKIEQYLRK